MKDKNELKDIIAELIDISKQSLLVNFRFFDVAIGLLNIQQVDNIGCVCTDSDSIYYDYKYLRNYIKNNTSIDKMLMHILMHLLLGHIYNCKNKVENLWNLACDIAVESILIESGIEYSNDEIKIIFEIEELKRNNIELIAEKIYKYFLHTNISSFEVDILSEIFRRDNHYMWYMELDVDEDEQKSDNNKINVFNSRKDLLDKARNNISDTNKRKWDKCLNHFSQKYSDVDDNIGENEGNLIQRILEIKKDKIDYSDFLRKFAVSEEEMKINEDEFDYIYYNYGMEIYSNVALIEPLEYNDNNKIREFVIILDTSGSCSGDIIQTFIEKTYSILMNRDIFSNEVKIHIIQNDTQIQSDIVINDVNDFKEIVKNINFTGFGGTDFRPAFDYVSNLVDNKYFENLRGVLYFTDGYGIYPEYEPKYKTAFVFVDNGMKIPDVPNWAKKAVINEYELIEG